MNKKEWLKPTIALLNGKIESGGGTTTSFPEYSVNGMCVSGACVTIKNTYTTGANSTTFQGSCEAAGAVCS